MVTRTERLLLLSSEHGTNYVPPRHAALFAGRGALLASHRGHDIGSAQLARALAGTTAAPLYEARVTRLLVDCNRSPGHRRLFSEFSRLLPAAEREDLLESYYRPHRDTVTAATERHIGDGRAVLHISVHSFTRVLDGRERNADIGLLYDPSRPTELELCRRWHSLLGGGEFRVRRNYPYRGVADGLATALRRLFPEPSYAGVELEVCQDIAAAGGERWSRMIRLIGDTLAGIVLNSDGAMRLD